MAAKPKNLNVRMTRAEYSRIRGFAAFQGISITDLVMESVFERIGDWQDGQDVCGHGQGRPAGFAGADAHRQSQE
jgi:hypothetical protein